MIKKSDIKYEPIVRSVKRRIMHIDIDVNEYFESHNTVILDYNKDADADVIKEFIDNPEKCKLEVCKYLTPEKIRTDLLRYEMANCTPTYVAATYEDIKDVFLKDLERYYCIFENNLEDNHWNYHECDTASFKCPENAILFTNTIRIQEEKNAELNINLNVLTAHLQKYCSDFIVSCNIKEDNYSEFMWVTFIVVKR
jgi:hypothetical protein